MENNSQEKGATILECSVILPFLLIFAVVSMDLLRIAYQQLALQYVLTSEKRQVLIGAYPDAATTRQQFGRRLAQFGLTLNAQDTLTVCPLKDYKHSCHAGSVMRAPPGELIVLDVQKQVDAFLLGQVNTLASREITLGARGIGRSEPE